MKYVIATLCISMFLINLSTVQAATGNTILPQPSLMTQMKKQEIINKQNTIVSKLREKAQKKQEAKDRLTALKNERLTKKNSSVNPVTTPSISTLQTPGITLSIDRPPKIAPIQIPTQPTVTQNTNIPTPSNVNIETVRSTWVNWYNTVRKSEWLGAYSYDTRLDATSYDWNIQFAKWKWLNHHRRNPSDSYYDFPVIDSWFMARGIDPKVINRSKHTENVWYGYYSCNSGDCTSALISSIRSTFDFFMSEKGKSYDAHYRSIVNPYFTKIGLSIIVVPEEKRYYLTVHYITE